MRVIPQSVNKQQPVGAPMVIDPSTLSRPVAPVGPMNPPAGLPNDRRNHHSPG